MKTEINIADRRPVSFSVMKMIEDTFAISILVSIVAVPFVLWLRQQKVYDVFHTQGRWTIALNCVLVSNVVAAILHLSFRTRLFDVTVVCWTGILFIAFIWIRTIALVTHKVST